ncbi:MAG: DUF72 domain-containing protein [Candidatus Hadarchaeales archaeon]
MVEILVGCCGYPCSRPKYYEKFKTVEIQSTFYKLPKPETASKWREEAPEGFVFTFKAFQGITHPTTSPTWRRSGLSQEELKGKEYGWLRPTEDNFEAWERTVEIGELLGARVCVVQCPPNFKYTKENVENMKKFFKKVKRKFSIAWEPRGDWGKYPEEIRKLCRELDLIHCVDPFRQEPLHFSRGMAYFRLHGLGKPSIYKYKFSDGELGELAKRARKMEREVKEVYFMFNNVYMLEDALRFLKLMEGA